MYLDENLLSTHHLDYLANIGTGLLQEAELLAEEPHARVVVIPLSL